MKKLLLALLALIVLAFPTLVEAKGGSVRVRGYYRSNGTYVAPHYRSTPDSSVWNNWSTVGNVNPYTGKEGTKNPYGTSSSYSGGIPTSDSNTTLMPLVNNDNSPQPQSIPALNTSNQLSSRWAKVASNGTYDYYIDTQSITKVLYDPSFWFKISNSGSISGPQKATISCNSRRFNDKDIVPESIEEAFLNFVCRD